MSLEVFFDNLKFMMENNMADLFADLSADIDAEDTAIDSLVTYANGVPALVQDAVNKAVAGDQAAAQALIDKITAKTAEVVAAVPNSSQATPPAAPDPAAPTA